MGFIETPMAVPIAHTFRDRVSKDKVEFECGSLTSRDSRAQDDNADHEPVLRQNLQAPSEEELDHCGDDTLTEKQSDKSGPGKLRENCLTAMASSARRR